MSTKLTNNTFRPSLIEHYYLKTRVLADASGEDQAISSQPSA
jgi:hypothetical protein